MLFSDFFFDQQPLSSFSLNNDPSHQKVSGKLQPDPTATFNVYKEECDSFSIAEEDNFVPGDDSSVFSDPEVDHPYYAEETTHAKSMEQCQRCTPHSHLHLKLISTQQEPLLGPSAINSNDLCIDIE